MLRAGAIRLDGENAMTIDVLRAVKCPWHGSQFSMADANVCQGPATAAAHVYETRIRDGNVEVRRRQG
jgi:nitrite reductase/ring-hydroxylating ferredoxin subunit